MICLPTLQLCVASVLRAIALTLRAHRAIKILGNHHYIPNPNRKSKQGKDKLNESKWLLQFTVPEMFESGPSGCLQSAPLTGTHQGAAATAFSTVDLTSSDSSTSRTKESPNFSACMKKKIFDINITNPDVLTDTEVSKY